MRCAPGFTVGRDVELWNNYDSSVLGILNDLSHILNRIVFLRMPSAFHQLRMAAELQRKRLRVGYMPVKYIHLGKRHNICGKEVNFIIKCVNKSDTDPAGAKCSPWERSVSLYPTSSPSNCTWARRR